MKTLILLLGILSTQSALALPKATDLFSSLLPYGRYDGDHCTVRVSRTITGNVKVSVINAMYKMDYLILKDQYYRYMPEEYFAAYTDKKVGRSTEKNYLMMTFSSRGTQVLVGRYSSQYSSSADCAIF